MDNRIKADSNQESKTTLTSVYVHVTFVSDEVKRDFLSVLDSRGLKTGGLEVTVVNTDGSCKGRIKPINDTDNVSTKLVVGNHIRTKPDETVHANENISVQHQLPVTEGEVDDSESVTLQAEKLSVPDDEGSKEKMVGTSHLLTDRSTNVSVGSVHSPRTQSPLLIRRHQSSSIPTGMQGEATEDFYSSSPESNVAMAAVSSVSSYLQAPAGRRHQSTTTTSVSTGMCFSQTSDGSGKETLARSDEIVKEKQHTIYCVLHGIESSVSKYYDTIEECKRFYDKTFADDFEQFLTENASSSDFSNKLSLYLRYIEDHLKFKKCLSLCSRLWKFCAANTVCSVFQYADEGLLIYSKIRKEEIGSICEEYVNVKGRFKELGKGGFGKVYKYKQPDTEQRLAIKIEERRPLAGCDGSLFHKIINLKHQNVIEMIEYLAGPVNEQGKRLYLFVMPLMNRKDLKRQFKTHKCVLDYMTFNPAIQKFIFRNYLILFCQVFEGLRYLQTQRIVHRDLKPSNIFVHQKCNCKNTMLCDCTDATDTVLYVVGDLDLLCFEGVSCSTKFEEWKMTQHDPAGTIEMKPLEAFYSTVTGEPVIDHRSDIWSGSVTMMNVLVAKGAKWEPHDQIKKFLSILTSTIRTASNDFTRSCKMLDDLVDKLRTSLVAELKTSKELSNMFAEYKPIRKLLHESNNSLIKMQSFQGGVPEVYKEESPLAGILSTVYIANSLHWVCLNKLPSIHGTNLWICMIKTLDCIAEGVEFLPDKRQDAGKFVELLKPLQIQVMK